MPYEFGNAQCREVLCYGSCCLSYHAGKVVGEDVRSHFELVDDHGAEGGRGREQGAVDHQDVHVARVCARLLQHVLHHVANYNLVQAKAIQ